MPTRGQRMETRTRVTIAKFTDDPDIAEEAFVFCELPGLPRDFTIEDAVDAARVKINAAGTFYFGSPGIVVGDPSSQ